jgi:hypothetical protein
MNDTQNRGPCEQYDHLVKRMQLYKYHLDLVKNDLELINEGWDLNFALDFSQLYLFAFPMDELIQKIADRTPPSEAERNRLVNLQAARGFVFYELKKCPKPILLPPYAIELRNFLAVQESRRLQRNLYVRFIKKWPREMFSNSERNILNEITQWYDSHETDEDLPEQLFKKGINFFSSRFRDLFFLISGSSREGLTIIRNLFSEEAPRVLLAHQRWPRYSKFISEVVSKPESDSIWFEMLSDIRGKWDSDYRDAAAIELAIELSKMLKKKKKPEIVLLVSDAFSMNAVLNWDKSEDKKLMDRFKGKPLGILELPSGKEVRLLRTSDTFLLFLLHAGKTFEESVDKVGEEHRRVMDFFKRSPRIEDLKKECALYDKRNNRYSEYDPKKCKECKRGGAVCDNLKNWLKNYESMFDQLEATKLYLYRKSYLIPFKDMLEDKYFMLKEALRLSIFLLGRPSNQFESIFEDKEIELQKQMVKTQKELGRLTIEVDKESMKEISYRIGQFTGIPHKIQFSNPKILEILYELKEDIKAYVWDFDKLKSLTSKIFEVTDSWDPYDDSMLLLSVLFFAYGEYALAEEISIEALSADDLQNRFEYEYIRCLALHKRGLAKKELKPLFLSSIELCEQLCSKYQDEPRACYLLGIIVRRGIEAGLVKKYTLDDAINKFKKALLINDKIIKDIDLTAAILNNIACTVCAKEQVDEHSLDIAWEAIQRLEQPPIGIESWHPKFFDTKSCVLLLRALREPSQSERKKHLLRAEESINKALDLAKMAGAISIRDSKSMQKHKKRILDALKQIEAL